MSKHPDFTQIGLGQPDIQPGPKAERPPFMTAEELPIQPAYTAEDVAGLDFIDGYPGAAPYHRGPYPTMFVQRPWTIRQYAASPRRRNPTPSIAAISRPARKACRWRSIWPPTAAMTATIRA